MFKKVLEIPLEKIYGRIFFRRRRIAEPGIDALCNVKHMEECLKNFIEPLSSQTFVFQDGRFELADGYVRSINSVYELEYNISSDKRGGFEYLLSKEIGLNEQRGFEIAKGHVGLIDNRSKMDFNRYSVNINLYTDVLVRGELKRWIDTFEEGCIKVEKVDKCDGYY